MANYRVTIQIVGNTAKALSRMARDVGNVDKGITGVISKFGAWGKVIGTVASGLGGLARLSLKARGAFMFGGGRLLTFGANTLASAQMSEGIRLLQRRQQARIGFGPQHARAQRRADLLAISHGLNPADVVASMNVLTGLRIGKSKLNLGQAEHLTQAGGLIAQQAGLPFETVMVNLQQMLAQTGKVARDVRQLLTHAPIIGRYATQLMEERGIKGMTHVEYLNDKSVLFDVLQRYIDENPSIGAMRGQGIVRMAQTEFYSNLATNPKWLEVANKYSGMLKEIGSAAYELVTAFTDSTTINASIRAFIAMLKDIPGAIDKVAAKFDAWLGPIARFFGLDWDGYKEQGFIEAEREKAIKGHVSANLDQYRAYGLRELGKSKATDAEIIAAVVEGLRRESPDFSKFVTEHLYNPSATTIYEMGTSAVPSRSKTILQTTPLTLAEQKALYTGDYTFSSVVTSKTGGMLNKGAISQYIARPTEEAVPPPLTGADVQGATGLAGETIGGYARDRKALVINFNAPIVEWDSTINAEDPQDVVNTVSETIEGATSRAIQIALLGATGKMGTRF